ncbi:hypothetical protein RUM44_010205, partial [Polyplax serrata]
MRSSRKGSRVRAERKSDDDDNNTRRYKKEEETGLTYGPVNEEYGKEKEEQNKKGTRERNVQKEQQSNSRITKFENNG